LFITKPRTLIVRVSIENTRLSESGIALFCGYICVSGRWSGEVWAGTKWIDELARATTTADRRDLCRIPSSLAIGIVDLPPEVMYLKPLMMTAMTVTIPQ